MERHLDGSNRSHDRAARIGDLLRADGFDNSFSAITEDGWRSTVSRWIEILGITPDMSVFEVGCGAGALLHGFYELGCRVGGLDLSDSLIELARQVMPEGTSGSATPPRSLPLKLRTWSSQAGSSSIFSHRPTPAESFRP